MSMITRPETQYRSYLLRLWRADRENAWRVMLECVDFRSVFIDQFAQEGISDESAECLADGFDDDFLRALAKAEFSGDGADPTADPAQAEKFFNLITDCLSFEEMSNLGG